jgi:IclR family pca regulon transcriptional regulator
MTLSEIARVTGMSRATVRRFLLTLVKEGYAETDGKYFGLRPKVLELGYAALSSMTMLDVMQPIMTRLAETVQESVFAAVLEETDVVYIASAAPPERIVSISVSVGSRAPAHCVSSGRILVASLSEKEQDEYFEKAKLTRLTPNTVTSKVELRSLIEEARVKDWSIVDQELEIGLRSISVPIRDRSGKVVAALNVACPSSRITPEDMRSKVLLELQAASQAITAGLQK